MENKVDFVEKLSTQKKRRKTAKVTYTPTYPHYPHEYCENYGAFIMVTCGTDVLWSYDKKRLLTKNVDFGVDFLNVINKKKLIEIVAKRMHNVV